MLSETTHRANGTPPLTSNRMSGHMADDKIFRLGAESKICSKCGEEKPRTEFNKERGKERAYCRPCHVAYSSCQIPGRTGKHGKLAVDHCHSTGRVRGLLCASCNVAVGILGDSPERLERVLAYLRGQDAQANSTRS